MPYFSILRRIVAHDQHLVFGHARIQIQTDDIRALVSNSGSLLAKYPFQPVRLRFGLRKNALAL
jgi:hypothetical protein